MKDSGQAILEFALGTLLITTTVICTGRVLMAQWDRAHCAYRVFELAHARLVGQPTLPTLLDIRTEEDETSVSGRGRCGDASEAVGFRKLEATPW